MSEAADATRSRNTRKQSTAWGPFARSLSAVLEQLGEDQFLVISVKESNRFVQFAGQGAFGLRAEVVSNHYLPPPEQLDAHQVSRLAARGWQLPTGTPDTAAPDRDPDGGPNFFIDCPAPVAWDEIAETAVQALVGVLDVLHPGCLVYDAFDSSGGQLSYPTLMLRRAAPTQSAYSVADYRQRLLSAVREATGLGALAFDQDDDIPVHYGSVAAFVRLLDDPPRACLHALLLTDVQASPRLLARLNQLNQPGGALRFLHIHDTVAAYAEVPARPFIAEHIAQALHGFCVECDGVAPALRSQFGAEGLTGGEGSGHTLH